MDSNILYFGKLIAAEFDPHITTARAIFVRNSDNIGEFLSWEAYGGRLFQHKPVGRISWEDALVSKLVPGVEITVDKMRFLCRLPLVDQDLDACSAKRWEKPFWAFNSSEQANTAYEIYADAPKEPIRVYGPELADVRLVLEPICPDIQDFCGKTIRLLMPTCILTVKVLDINDYDLVCTNAKWLTGDVSNDWCRWDNNRLYIMRDAVLNAGLC